MNKKRGWTLVITSLGLMVVGFVLYLVGVLMMGDPEDVTAETLGPAVVFIFLSLPILLGALVCYVVWFATSSSDMNQITGGRFNTTLWTILLFVPFANLVSLYKFADHIHEAQNARGVTGLHPVLIFLLMWVLSLVGWPVAQAQMDKLG